MSESDKHLDNPEHSQYRELILNPGAGLRVEAQHELPGIRVAMESGAHYGGDLSTVQRWRVARGAAWLSCDDRFVRKPVYPPEVFEFKAQDRVLLIALSPVVFTITAVP